MDKIQLQKFCNSGLSQREIGKKIGVSTWVVGHWMRKYGIKNESSFYLRNRDSKKCPSCQTEKPMEEFYSRFSDGSGSSTYCKVCTQKRVNQRGKSFKQKCVDYKGGKCQICNYSKYLSALEFHHRDPNSKDITISQNITASFDDIKPELDKCDLLCCRCHRETHENLNLKF